METDLGEQPTPEIEPAEPPPGGVDAVEDELYETAPLVPDLSHVGNEGSRTNLPDEPIGTEAGAAAEDAEH